jgi:hypothetical protein
MLAGCFIPKNVQKGTRRKKGKHIRQKEHPIISHKNKKVPDYTSGTFILKRTLIF